VLLLRDESDGREERGTCDGGAQNEIFAFIQSGRLLLARFTNNKFLFRAGKKSSSLRQRLQSRVVLLLGLHASTRGEKTNWVVDTKREIAAKLTKYLSKLGRSCDTTICVIFTNQKRTYSTKQGLNFYVIYCYMFLDKLKVIYFYW
jgi:hypothetical protein